MLILNYDFRKRLQFYKTNMLRLVELMPVLLHFDDKLTAFTGLPILLLILNSTAQQKVG